MQAIPIDLDEVNIVALSEFDGRFIESEFWSFSAKIPKLGIKAQLCFLSSAWLAMRENFFQFLQMQAIPIDRNELNIVALSEFDRRFIESEFWSIFRKKANIRLFS